MRGDVTFNGGGGLVIPHCFGGAVDLWVKFVVHREFEGRFVNSPFLNLAERSSE